MPKRDFLLDRMEHFLRTRLALETFDAEKRFRPSLTISRECGAGMDEIGCLLVAYLSEVDDSTELGWALFNQGMIGKIIEEHHLPKSGTPFLAEDAKFPVVDSFGQLLNLQQSDWTLFNYSADTIRNLCMMGNAIVVGRGGNFVTADLENTFHVRLVGSLKKRIRHTAKRHKISSNRATEVVEETDKCRKKFVRRHARANAANPNFYHMVLNTDNLTSEIAARIIADSLLEWAHHKEKESIENADIS